MWHEFVADDKFFEVLRARDEAVAAEVRAAGCPSCGRRLDRADFPRKPRGGLVAAAGEVVDRRISLCCSAEGCRRRATPPSLVFLGRRVYLALAVIVEAGRRALGIAPRPSPPPRRTVGRWRAWFRAELVRTSFFVAARGRFASPPDEATMPASLVEPFVRTGGGLAAALAFLAPVGASPAVAWARSARAR